MKRSREALKILDLCPLIDAPPDNKNTLCGISDLHVLLMLASENMADHSVFRYCLDAQKMTTTVKESKNPYLDMLVTKTAWGMADAADAKASDVLKKFTS